MPNDDSVELQREWRQIVLAKLNVLELGQRALEERLAALSSFTIKPDEFKGLETRVRELEELKIRAIGAFVVLQGIAMFFAWVWSNFIKP